MNPQIPYYRTHGLQATGTVTVIAMPTVGNTVTIDGTAYTFGTSFTGRNLIEVAEGLAAVINSQRNSPDLNLNGTQPLRSHYATYFGTVVRIVAAVPGTAGNAMTLATSNASAFTVSGAVLSGGTAAPSTAPSTATATQLVWYEQNGQFTNAAFTKFIGGAAVWAQKAILHAYDTNAVNVLFGPAALTSGWRELAPGDEFVIEAPPGCAFDINTWYGKSKAVGTTNMHILYC